MATSPTTLTAWIAPSQTKLLLEVAKLSGLPLIAVGSDNIDDSKECASMLNTEGCHDLRTMITTFDDSLLWIAQPSAYDISLLELLRHRTGQTVTSTPLGGSLELLVDEAGQSPAAKFIPLLKRSSNHGQIKDDLEQFGLAQLIHCTMTCSPSEGTLGARLFDAMDFIDNLLGTPESVHAFHVGAEIPNEACELQGNMTVNLKFPHQTCATLMLSDQVEWKREIQMINNAHTIVTADQSNLAALIWDGMQMSLNQDQKQEVADAPRIVALCEAARLSCLTGSIEQPSTILSMFEL